MSKIRYRKITEFGFSFKKGHQRMLRWRICMCSLLANPLSRVSLFLFSISITLEFILTLLELHHCTCYFLRSGPTAASLSAMNGKECIYFLWSFAFYRSYPLSGLGFLELRLFLKLCISSYYAPLVALVIFSKFSSTAHTDNVGIRFGHTFF